MLTPQQIESITRCQRIAKTAGKLTRFTLTESNGFAVVRATVNGCRLVPGHVYTFSINQRGDIERA